MLENFLRVAKLLPHFFSGQAIAIQMARLGLGKNKVEEGNYFALCRWLTDSLYPLFFHSLEN